MNTENRSTYLSDPARERLARQIFRAGTLEEVQAARTALRAWMRSYPEDTGMLDGGEMLYMLEDGLKTLAAEEALMTEEERVHTRARRALSHLAQSPSSLSEVEAAERGLHRWLCEHPGDEEMRGLDPTLAMYREMYEILAEDDAAAGEAARRGAAVPELAAR